MPSSPKRGAPCIQATLRLLATRWCEQCGLAGFFARRHVLELQFVIPIAIAAAIAGDNLGFLIGRRAGRARIEQGRRFLWVTKRRPGVCAVETVLLRKRISGPNPSGFSASSHRYAPQIRTNLASLLGFLATDVSTAQTPGPRRSLLRTLRLLDDLLRPIHHRHPRRHRRLGGDERLPLEAVRPLERGRCNRLGKRNRIDRMGVRSVVAPSGT